MQLARTKRELRKQETELAENVNIYYKEIDSYSSSSTDNVGAVTRIGRTSVLPLRQVDKGTETEKLMETVNKLKVRNIALEMEINSLRCSFVVNFTKDERRKDELRAATEEPRALKTELTTLRDEKVFTGWTGYGHFEIGSVRIGESCFEE